MQGPLGGLNRRAMIAKVFLTHFSAVLPQGVLPQVGRGLSGFSHTLQVGSSRIKSNRLVLLSAFLVLIKIRESGISWISISSNSQR